MPAVFVVVSCSYFHTTLIRCAPGFNQGEQMSRKALFVLQDPAAPNTSACGASRPEGQTGPQIHQGKHL